MQKLLWIVTALAALILAAIMVVPRFVDWNQYRAEIAAAAERATGRPVTIEGEVNLLLLPTPTLSAARVHVGNPTGFASSAAGFADIKSIDARFALWPLLLGRVEIESVALIEPKLTLVDMPDGSRNWRIDDAMDAIYFDRLIIVGGSMEWGGPHPDRVTQINAELVDQPSQTGVASDWRMAGDGQFHELAWQANLIVGEPGASGRPATATVGLRGGSASFRVAGTVSGADWNSGSFAGKLTGDAARIPVLLRLLGLATPAALTERGSIEASVTADTHRIGLSDIAVTVGDLRLAGRMEPVLDPQLGITATLNANRLDLARWLAMAPAGAEAVVTPIAALSGASLPNGKIDLGIDAIFWRDGLIRGAKLQASMAGGEINVQQATAQLPGGSDLSLFGTLSTGDKWRFAGRMEAGSDNLRALLAWLAIDIGAVPPDRLRRIAATASFDAAADRIDVSALDLSFDSSKLTGDFGVTFGPRLGATANLNIDRANLDAYLPSSLAGLDGAWRDATDLAVRLHGDQLTWRDLALGDAGLAVTLHDGTFETAANVADFAGGRLQFSGNWAHGAGPDGQMDATLRLALPDAARLAPLIQPDAVLPPLGAGDLKLDLHGAIGHPAATLSASFAGANVDADGIASFDATPAAITVGINHPAALGLLQRFVPSYLPNGDASGPLSLTGRLAWQGGVATLEDITARIGPTNLVGTLSLDRTATRPRLVASLAASALDLGVLLPPGSTIPTDWFNSFDMDFGLRIGAVDAGAMSLGDLAATGSLRDRHLTISDLSASWLGGTLSGQAKAEMGVAGSLDLDVKLVGASAGEAAAMLVGDPDPKGNFDFTATLSSQGSDLRGLVANLGGGGTMRAGAGSVDGFDLAQTAPLLLSDESLGSLLPQVTARMSGGTTRYRAIEGEIRIDGGSVRTIDGTVTLDPPANGPPANGGAKLAVHADITQDHIEIEPRDAKSSWHLRISGALAAGQAASGSPAATKLYDLVRTDSP